MPFSVPVPALAMPSLEISPVESSLLDVSYFVEVVITETKAPGDDKKKTNKKTKKGKKDAAAAPMSSVFGVTSSDRDKGTNPTTLSQDLTALVRSTSKIHVSKEYGAEPNMCVKHEKAFTNTSMTKMFMKKDFIADVVLYSDVIYPGFENEMRVKIDNTKYGSAISGVRLSLTRTVVARTKGGTSEHRIEVANEEISSATHRGGPGNQMIVFDERVKTPSEHVEKHPFYSTDGRT